MRRRSRGWLTGLLGISLFLGSTGSAGAVQAQTVNDYEGHWAQQSIENWLNDGTLKGFEDGSVRPDQMITRAEFMALINRIFEFKKVTLINFTDISPSSWAYSEVGAAVAAGYIQGYNNEVRPEAGISRQEAAVVISKLLFLELPQHPLDSLAGFTDSGTIASWSAGSVAAVVNASVMKGYPDGTFKPERAMTRAEVISVLEPLSRKTGGYALFDKSGEYGSLNEQSLYKLGNVRISAGGVTLQNMDIQGNLIFSTDIGNGEITLKNVNVRGNVIVNGGTADSIHLLNSTLGRLTVNNPSGSVTLITEGSTLVKTVQVQTPVKLVDDSVSSEGFTDILLVQELPAGTAMNLSGLFDNVTLYAKGDMQLSKGAIASLVIGKGAGGSGIRLAAGTLSTKLELGEIVNITGAGQIRNAVFNDGSAGSTFEFKPLSVEGPEQDSIVITGPSS